MFPVHADIKPANFVLVKGYLKLIDFGLAGKMPENAAHLDRSFIAGTKDYMSPESLSIYVFENGQFDVEAMRKHLKSSKSESK